MPLNEFLCRDCGARIEKLHPLGKPPKTCGLDCRRQGEGAFGSGVLEAVLAAPSLITKTRGTPDIGDVHREAMRKKALRRMGNELTESDLDKLRDGGMTVYRKDGHRSWTKDGGDAQAPGSIKGPKD